MNINIAYIIIDEYDPNDPISYFNEYEASALRSIDILKKIIDLPKDFPEIYCSKEQRIADRLTGSMDGYNIFYINNYNNIRDIELNFKVVFIRSNIDLSEVDENCIFVSLDPKISKNNKIYTLNDLDTNLLKKQFTWVINNFNQNYKIWISKFKDIIGNGDSNKKIKTDLSFPNNSYIRSNIGVLRSIKVDIEIEKKENNDSKYLESSVNLINYIKSNIYKNMKPAIYLPSVDYYISDFSNNFKFLIDKSDYKLHSLQKNNVNNAKELLKVIKDLNQGKINVPSNTYTSEYLDEVYMLDTLISLSASKHITPILKIKLFNSKIFSKLKDIGVSDRGHNSKKINLLVKRLTQELDSCLSPVEEYFDSKYSSNLKIVSNIPIEWSNHIGLPLMIRHETSRIPVSPGYVSTKLLLDNSNIYIKKDSFREILFISSFKDDDPIKNHLLNSISITKTVPNDTEQGISDLLKSNDITKDVKLDLKAHNPINTKIIWKNISNKNDLINSLNGNKSPITVFDLHGGHDEEGMGFIQLKDELVYIYDLIGKIKVSPIVILSSCDTSPIDRNHYTTSNAFFLAGAKTVLASALPINSREASVFISRLLIRIRDYLPVRIDKVGKSIRWSSFITGMLRKSYYNELLDLIKKRYSFTAQEKQELTFHIACLLDPLHEDWHNKIIELISKKLRISSVDLERIIKNDFAFCESMKYIQMGNPESVIIVSDDIPTRTVQSS